MTIDHRSSRMLAAVAFLLSATSVAIHAATAAPPSSVLQYYYWTPNVAVVGQSTLFTFTAVIEGSRTSAELVTAAGPVFPLTKVARDTYQLTLTSAQILDGYSEGDGHNFVGYLDIYDGTTRTYRINNFMNVLDSTAPNIHIVKIATDAQVGPHVVNIRRDTLWLSVSLPLDVFRRFYQLFEDDVDFIVLVSQVRKTRNRTYGRLRNDTTGIGLDPVDNGSVLGSADRLQGVISMPIDSFFDLASPGSLHEIGHRWCCFLDNPEFSQGSPHWPISNVAYGMMGFGIPGSFPGGEFSYELIEQPNGDYIAQRVEPAREYNSLEMYLMGLASADEVVDSIVFQDQDAILSGGPIRGPVDVITIEDIIAVNGPRVPAAGSSQSDFRIASIILSAGRLLDADEMAFFDHMSARGEATSELQFTEGFVKGMAKPFFVATGGRATLTTVPEPERIIMIASGIVFLAAINWRKKRTANATANTTEHH